MAAQSVMFSLESSRGPTIAGIPTGGPCSAICVGKVLSIGSTKLPGERTSKQVEKAPSSDLTGADWTDLQAEKKWLWLPSSPKH